MVARPVEEAVDRGCGPDGILSARFHERGELQLRLMIGESAAMRIVKAVLVPLIKYEVDKKSHESILSEAAYSYENQLLRDLANWRRGKDIISFELATMDLEHS